MRERKIDLGKNTKEILAFNDPSLPDLEFQERLINEIYMADPAVTMGTTSASYKDSVKESARRAVREAAAKHGNDRNSIIFEAFQQCWNSQPLPLMGTKLSSVLQGSDYLKWAEAKACASSIEYANLSGAFDRKADPAAELEKVLTPKEFGEWKNAKSVCTELETRYNFKPR